MFWHPNIPASLKLFKTDWNARRSVVLPFPHIPHNRTPNSLLSVVKNDAKARIWSLVASSSINTRCLNSTSARYATISKSDIWSSVKGTLKRSFIVFRRRSIAFNALAFIIVPRSMVSILLILFIFFHNPVQYRPIIAFVCHPPCRLVIV